MVEQRPFKSLLTRINTGVFIVFNNLPARACPWFPTIPYGSIQERCKFRVWCSTLRTRYGSVPLPGRESRRGSLGPLGAADLSPALGTDDRLQWRRLPCSMTHLQRTGLARKLPSASIIEVSVNMPGRADTRAVVICAKVNSVDGRTIVCADE